MSKRQTQEEFIQKAVNKHGDKCDYSLVEYVKSNIKVFLICKLHGIFKVTPNSHLSKNGTGCMKCRGALTSNRQLKTKEYFLNRAKEVHCSKYDYVKVDYKGVSEPVEIVCREHGSFWQRPDHHYSGSGCSSCQNFGFRPNLPGNFYILKSGNITKVGICNRDISIRLKGINKSSGKNFKIFFSLNFETGKIPLQVETDVLKYLKLKYESPSEIYDGSTECFYGVDTFDLMTYIRKLGEKYD